MKQRIVSLVPSQTELLYHLGLAEEVVGITKFCIHPTEWFRNKKRVGGTKNIHIDLVRSLQPTIVLANKEENVKEQVEALEDFVPVYVSDITTLEDALEMIREVGRLTGKISEAAAIAESIIEEFTTLEYAQALKAHPPLRAGYLIWRNPYMAAGGDTFIHDLMKRCGWVNVLEDTQRYPAITAEQLAELDCQLLLLSSEPYPFRQKHIDELQHQLPQTKIILADGEMFSWYGSRLMYAPKYFQQLLENIHSNT